MMKIMIVFYISVIVVLVINFIFYFLSFKKSNDKETVSGYECGFEGGHSSRMMFSYRFFLISILFLIFDVEIVLLIPFSFVMNGVFEVIFVLILFLGLVYEYLYGSLDWL